MFRPVLGIAVDELMRVFNLTKSEDIEIKGEVEINLKQQPDKDIRGRIDYTVNESNFTENRKPFQYLYLPKKFL